MGAKDFDKQEYRRIWTEIYEYFKSYVDELGMGSYVGAVNLFNPITLENLSLPALQAMQGELAKAIERKTKAHS